MSDQPMKLSEHGELLCPMPVLRKDYDDIADRYNTPRLERCDERLYLSTEDSLALYIDGEMGTCGPSWKIECQGGHVLVVPDHEADDNYERLPYNEGTVHYALCALARVDLSGVASGDVLLGEDA